MLNIIRLKILHFVQKASGNVQRTSENVQKTTTKFRMAHAQNAANLPNFDKNHNR